MNSYECFNYLKNYKEFIGVYPRDKLTFTIPNGSGIIINTDKYGEPGQHWVAIYNGDKTIYFDSFGLPPLRDEFIDFLDSINKIGWYHNRICFQSIYQDTCGMYCVFFLACMFKYKSFNKFLDIFNKNKHLNDILAKLLYKIQF